VTGLLAGVGGFWLLWASPGPKPGPHRVTIEEGSTLASVAQQLDQGGIIPGTAKTYRGMAKLFGSSDPIQAGEFEIPAGTGGAKVLDILQHGRPEAGRDPRADRPGAASRGRVGPAEQL
jgi:UPF0755 protein